LLGAVDVIGVIVYNVTLNGLSGVVDVIGVIVYNVTLNGLSVVNGSQVAPNAIPAAHP
jgi:hypothetical protein